MKRMIIKMFTESNEMSDDFTTTGYNLFCYALHNVLVVEHLV